MAKQRLLDIIIVLGVAILCVVGYRLSSQTHSKADVALPVMVCNPGQQACSTRLPGGGAIDFSIGPAPIRPLHPLNLKITLNDLKAEQVEVDFAGSEMNMGYNRSVLYGSGNIFTGQAILPVCISGSMDWVATILITAGNRQFAVPFLFKVAGR